MKPNLLYRAILVSLSLVMLLVATAWQNVLPATASAATNGSWNGTTSRGHPMSFTVGSAGTQWSNFVLGTDFVATNCYGVEVTMEIAVPGPGTISGSSFSRTSSNYSFTGNFSSASAASGTYNFTHYQVVIGIPFPPYVCFDYMTQSGTWSASIPTTISGNAGVGGATLSYTDSIPRAATADGTGNYTITVPSGWSGTVTPSKAGYAFSPANRSYSNLTAPQVAQNYTATVIPFTISGNTGLGGVVLSYVEGTPKTVISNGSGNYAITIPSGWSGTVTPSRAGYTFSPPSRTYSNVLANQTAQNYTAMPITYTIAGNTGVGGTMLSYTDGSPKTVLSDTSGNYSLPVSYNWSGTVRPSKAGYTFSPPSRTYGNVLAHLTAQNYTALVTIAGNTGAAGVTLSYSDGGAKTVTSLANGSYSLPVTYNWSGTVTPTHACFTFTPPNKNYSSVTTSQTGHNYTPSLRAGSGCADIDARIGGVTQGRFGLLPGASTRTSFAGVNSGPVQIVGTNGVSLIAAERLIYKVNGVNASFTEMMGLPDSELDNVYWLPWYNNVDLDTQLRFANVSGSPATVQVTIGGTPMPSFNLAAGASTRKSFAGVNSGPVKIESNVNIVAAERVIYKVNNINTSFSEMMGLPEKQLDTTYWLPWYNNVDLDTQLRIANTTDSPATVQVTIGGTPMPSFNLAAGASTRKSYAGVNNGPVQIVSTHGVPIVAAERVIYKVNNINTSFTEMMALPANQLNTTFWLPWYNNVDLDTQLRFANTTNSPATVQVTIGGTPMPAFTLAAGASTRKSFAGINNGPVQIVSSHGVPIVAAERLIYKVNNINTSFSEMMGLPAPLLNSTFWLPWYNSIDLDTQLRFGVP